MLDFEKYIYSLLKKNIPRKSLVVEINRLKRRVINQTGFPIIKSKYGFGYVINS